MVLEHPPQGRPQHHEVGTSVPAVDQVGDGRIPFDVSCSDGRGGAPAGVEVVEQRVEHGKEEVDPSVGERHSDQSGQLLVSRIAVAVHERDGVGRAACATIRSGVEFLEVSPQLAGWRGHDGPGARQLG